MSLLWMDYDPEFQDLLDRTFQYENEKHPDYYAALSRQVKKIIYRDTRYNIDFLYTSYLLGDDKIMSDYARWLYKLLAPIFKDQTLSETADYIVDHFDSIRAMIPAAIPEEECPALLHLIDCAKDAVRDSSADDLAFLVKPSRYEAQIKEYLDSLLSRDTKKSLYLIQHYMDLGISINDIYVEILAESMRRVGEMWHTSRITVDTEHYCTSVTQMAMAQFYPVLFSRKRKGKTLLCACPGSELHEMGARMVADLFENDGWDSIYLGAAVPVTAMLEAIRSNQPDLIALSVTMPQHLIACQEMITAIRQEFPDIKLAVGGKAFASTHGIWEKWPVDIYEPDACKFLETANRQIG